MYRYWKRIGIAVGMHPQSAVSECSVYLLSDVMHKGKVCCPKCRSTLYVMHGLFIGYECVDARCVECQHDFIIQP